MLLISTTLIPVSDLVPFKRGYKNRDKLEIKNNMIQTRISSSSSPDKRNLILVNKENRNVSVNQIKFTHACFSQPEMMVSLQISQMNQAIMIQGNHGLKLGLSNCTRISKTSFCGGISWIPFQNSKKYTKSRSPKGQNIMD